jgi:hypothetical protein
MATHEKILVQVPVTIVDVQVVMNTATGSILVQVAQYIPLGKLRTALLQQQKYTQICGLDATFAGIALPPY